MLQLIDVGLLLAGRLHAAQLYAEGDYHGVNSSTLDRFTDTVKVPDFCLILNAFTKKIFGGVRQSRFEAFE